MSKTKKIMEVLTYQYYDTDQETGKPINMGIKPVFETVGAACADVAVPVAYTIPPHKGMKLNLRIGFDIPEGYNIIMYPRSSLLIKYGIISPVSKIDWDFKLAPVSVPVFNLTDEPVTFEAGTRVAQIELVPMSQPHEIEYQLTFLQSTLEKEGNNNVFILVVILVAVLFIVGVFFYGKKRKSKEG